MLANFKRILSTGKINSFVKLSCLSTIILIIIVISLFSGFPLPYLINNYRLNRFSEQLSEIPLPSQTEKIGAIHKIFGNLGPCSKHGDYYAEFRIATTLSHSRLKDFYNQFTIQIPEINSTTSSLFRGLGTHGQIAIEIEKIKGAKNEYVVFAFDPDYWPNDFRCW